MVPLRTQLMTGQKVEIITAPGARPDPSWLNFAVTGKARSHIRHFLKDLQLDEARRFGLRLLTRELTALSLDLDRIPPARMQAVLDTMKLECLDRLLEEVGLGRRMAPLVARSFQSELAGGEVETRVRAPEGGGQTAPLIIEGTEGMVVTFPKCCYPIPGDPILGYVSVGRGIVIHQASCKTVAEYRNQLDKWVDVHWAPKLDREFATEIRVEVVNRRGMLATIAAAIAEENVNIEEVEMTDRSDRFVDVRFVISVRGRSQVASLLRHIRRMEGILRVHRKRT
jgi:(p)ppGpp synthase/HD superfamily hydrolase